VNKTYTRDDSKNSFQKSHWIAEKYGRQLRDVARQIGRVIESHNTMTLSGLQAMQQGIEHYTDVLRPWALSVGKQVAQKLNAQDLAMWRKQSIRIGNKLRDEVESSPSGNVLADFMARQVHYITSLPTEAAQRVHDLSLEARTGGRRFDEVADEIARSGEVTSARATLIARTECARTGSLLTETRAQAIGATHYIWRTSQDSHVRISHKQMEGKVFEIGSPPLLSDGTRTAPGQIYNCFIGSTKVSLRDGCKNLWRYWHDGPIVSVTVDSGEVFNCTPNHPILTSAGWRAANDLQEGDKLIRGEGNGIGAIDYNEANFETSFDDLFSALSLSACPNRESGSDVAFNFHGDVPEHEVDHITVNRELLIDFITSRSKRGCNLPFSDTNSGGGSPVHRRFAHGGESSIAGFGNTESALLGSHGLHADYVGLGTSPDRDAMISEALPDALPCESKPIGEGFNAFSGIVGFGYLGNSSVTPGDHLLLGDDVRRGVSGVSQGDAEIVRMAAQDIRGLGVSAPGIEKDFCSIKKIKRENFSGHVFTLESFTGSYSITSAKIISKNCRCTSQIILPEL
jgi:SPP1 gp7 family putative phage head morphogenesis protein